MDKVVLQNIGNYIQHLVRTYNGKESDHKLHPIPSASAVKSVALSVSTCFDLGPWELPPQLQPLDKATETHPEL